MCSKQQVSEKAQEVGGKLPVQKHQQAGWESNPEGFYINHFWGRRPDGVAIDGKKTRVFFLEFNRSTDREEGFQVLKVKEAVANEQHSSIIEVLRAVVDGWAVEQVNFAVGNRGSVMEGDLYEKLERLRLDVQAGKKDNIVLSPANRWISGGR